MDATVMLMEKIAALEDAVYFRRAAAAVSALPGDAALPGFQGVLLGAPRRVDLSRESGLTALPAVILFLRAALRAPRGRPSG